MLKRQNNFNAQFKQSNTFNLFGFKLPRLFVIIMCILILIIMILIMEISYDAASDSNNIPNDIKKEARLRPESFMKNKISLETKQHNVIPVLIFCHGRPQYLERTLKSVYKYLNRNNWNNEFIIFISQDGTNKQISKIIRDRANKKEAYYLQFDYESTSKEMMKGFEQESWRVYHKISAHYKWALTKLLIELDYDRLIILEEDMEISPDFYSFFYTLSPLMDIDKSIYCISAWNDYGQKGLVKDPNALYRTDVFPGLGWMLTQDLWKELKDKFSLAFWDDWFRERKQTQNRSCIRPEISRTYTFGQIGSSGGWFYMEYLHKMELNKQNIDWNKHDLKYLLNDNYDKYLKNIIENAKEITNSDLPRRKMKRLVGNQVDRDFVAYYSNLQEYSIMSSKLHLMQDHKFGMPRQSYRGIVIVNWFNNRVLFVPKNVDWTPRNRAQWNPNQNKNQRQLLQTNSSNID